MQKVTNRGFTLIELLVVIAIIGILAGIVLASLGTARGKGNDAKIKEQLKSMQNAAEIYYASSTSYGVAVGSAGTGVVCTGATAVGMFADSGSGMAALTSPSAWPTGASPMCSSTGSAWAASATLSSGSWCVDSTGASTSTAGTLGTSAGQSHC